MLRRQIGELEGKSGFDQSQYKVHRNSNQLSSRIIDRFLKSVNLSRMARIFVCGAVWIFNTKS